MNDVLPFSLREVTRDTWDPIMPILEDGHAPASTDIESSTAEIRQLHDAAQQCTEAAAKFLEMQHRVLSQRNQVQYHREGVKTARRSLEESEELVRDAMKNQKPDRLSQNHRGPPLLISMLGQSSQHRKDFMDRVHNLQEQEDELSALEFAHQKRTEALVEQIQALHAATQVFGDHNLDPGVLEELDQHLGPEDTSEASRSSIIPPLLEEYYDKAGDVGVNRERLAEIRSEWDAEAAKRQLREDRGDVLDMSEEDFQRYWEDACRVAEEDYAQAITAADDAHRRCRDAGCDPSHWRKEPSEVSDISPNSPYRESQCTPAAQWTRLQTSRKESSFEQDAQTTLPNLMEAVPRIVQIDSHEIRERVENWRKRVRKDPSEEERTCVENDIKTGPHELER